MYRKYLSRAKRPLSIIVAFMFFVTSFVIPIPIQGLGVETVYAATLPYGYSRGLDRRGSMSYTSAMRNFRASGGTLQTLIPLDWLRTRTVVGETGSNVDWNANHAAGERCQDLSTHAQHPVQTWRPAQDGTTCSMRYVDGRWPPSSNDDGTWGPGWGPGKDCITVWLNAGCMVWMNKILCK